MSMMLMVKAMHIKVGNPLRKLVLIKLADNANDKGECWPSHQHIADQCEIARSTVRKHIKDLKSAGFLKIEHRAGVKGNTSNMYYLTLDNGVLQPTLCRQMTQGGLSDDTPPMPSDITRTSHSFEPVIEPLSEPTVPTKKYKFDSYQMEFAEWMYSQLLILNPNFKKPNLESWANTLRLMLEVDKRDPVEVGKVFAWANKDDFWSSNILSPVSLRKQYDKLVVKMKQPAKQQKVQMSGGGDWAKYAEETF